MLNVQKRNILVFFEIKARFGRQNQTRSHNFERLLWRESFKILPCNDEDVQPTNSSPDGFAEILTSPVRKGAFVNINTEINSITFETTMTFTIMTKLDFSAISIISAFSM